MKKYILGYPRITHCSFFQMSGCRCRRRCTGLPVTICGSLPVSCPLTEAQLLRPRGRRPVWPGPGGPGGSDCRKLDSRAKSARTLPLIQVKSWLSRTRRRLHAGGSGPLRLSVSHQLSGGSLPGTGKPAATAFKLCSIT